MIDIDQEDEWVAHNLAGTGHREEVLLWDPELDNAWPAEVRCQNCSVVRYMPNGEAHARINAIRVQRGYGTTGRNQTGLLRWQSP